MAPVSQSHLETAQQIINFYESFQHLQKTSLVVDDHVFKVADKYRELFDPGFPFSYPVEWASTPRTLRAAVNRFLREDLKLYPSIRHHVDQIIQNTKKDIQPDDDLRRSIIQAPTDDSTQDKLADLRDRQYEKENAELLRFLTPKNKRADEDPEESAFRQNRRQLRRQSGGSNISGDSEEGLDPRPSAPKKSIKMPGEEATSQDDALKLLLKSLQGVSLTSKDVEVKASELGFFYPNALLTPENALRDMWVEDNKNYY